ncbi:MAG: hypothetical protein E6R13_02005 [Spirochaetes bacterium]|nr:MAG: hypothetical protein E6R13_02005 [Spirochaetota bacterium]
MNESELRLRELENHGNNTLLYVLVIVVVLLVTMYLYTQYQESQQKTKNVEASALAQTKELKDLADSLKTGSTTLDTVENEGDVDSAMSATIESQLDLAEKSV